MSTLNRIVLCTEEGDELFSGSSMFSETPPPASQERGRAPGAVADEDEEPVPETLRSPVSGNEPVSRPIIVEEAGVTAA